MLTRKLQLEQEIKPEKFLKDDNDFNDNDLKLLEKSLKTENIMDLSDIYLTMNNYAKILIIKELKNHIYNPNKPGYKRNDIIKRIKELEDGN